jgi:competence protein ComEA
MKKLMLTIVMLFFFTVTAFAGLININTASMEVLESLPHIGPTKAAAIIEYRKNHQFNSIDELVNVKGIGAKTVEKLKSLITVAD